MNILRYLRSDCIRLSLDHRPVATPEEETTAQRANRLAAEKEAVLGELAEILENSGQINNPSKFLRDLINREKKATTAIIPGVAIPHVRSMQVKEFVMGFARADAPGVFFDCPDGHPTRFFFLLASPPYEDRLYLQVYREFATVLQDEESLELLASAAEPNDVFNALRRHFR